MVKDNIKFKIFKVLVDGADMFTLNQISKLIKEPAQKISYHLPQLEKMGLIIKDENKYYCQPCAISLRHHHAKSTIDFGSIFSLIALYLSVNKTKS